jgi:hypothetical protein
MIDGARFYLFCSDLCVCVCVCVCIKKGNVCTPCCVSNIERKGSKCCLLRESFIFKVDTMKSSQRGRKLRLQI